MVRKLCQLLSLHLNASGGDFSGTLRQKSHDAKGCGRLSCSGLSHQSHGFTGSYGKADAIHCIDDLQICFIYNGQILNSQHILLFSICFLYGFLFHSFVSS